MPPKPEPQEIVSITLEHPEKKYAVTAKFNEAELAAADVIEVGNDLFIRHYSGWRPARIAKVIGGSYGAN